MNVAEEQTSEKPASRNEPHPVLDQASEPTEEARLPGKTVFILGSGFSRPLGIPVMADFIPEGLTLLKNSVWRHNDDEEAKDDPGLLARILNLLRYYENKIAQLGCGTANLEDLFCLVDLLSGQDKPPNEHRRTLHEFIGRVCALAWKRHIEEWNNRQNPGPDTKTDQPHAPVVEFRHHFAEKRAPCPRIASKCGNCRHHSPQEKICNWPGPQCDGAGNVCLYEAFLSQVMFAEPAVLAPANCPPEYAAGTIITLNYDLILERIAERVGVRVYYGNGILAKKVRLDDSARGMVALSGKGCKVRRCLPLLKLHGSLNWKEPKKPDDPVPQCGLDEKGARKTRLIYPTWQRDPVGKKRSFKLLAAARRHLKLASRLVFIGYSMPETDRYLRYLFADVLATPELPEIEVCNLGWTVEQAKLKCRALLGFRAASRVTRVYEGLDAYVRAHKTQSSL